LPSTSGMPFNRPWRFGFPMGSRRPPKSPSAIEFGKRGGGATPVTADPNSLPTTPPQSSFKHGVPKINGSEGGFIGLIVGLGVFILICCGAIYYLLRARPKKLTAKSGSTQGSFFSSRRQRNAGWIQQTNEFEYESTDDEAGDHPSARYAEGGMGYAGRNHRGQQGGYADPFDPEKLPESVHQQQVPLKPIARMPASDPIIAHSSDPHGADATPKHSPTSPTFEGGTKFKEQF